MNGLLHWLHIGHRLNEWQCIVDRIFAMPWALSVPPCLELLLWYGCYLHSPTAKRCWWVQLQWQHRWMIFGRQLAECIHVPFSCNGVPSSLSYKIIITRYRSSNAAVWVLIKSGSRPHPLACPMRQAINMLIVHARLKKFRNGIQMPNKGHRCWLGLPIGGNDIIAKPLLLGLWQLCV